MCILDHGLYVRETEAFRLKYCEFWKSLFLMDTKNLERICHDWGIDDVTMFASATLQRPYDPKKAIHIASDRVTAAEIYRMQMRTKERITKLLADTEKIPQELIFVGRNLNLVRANNKHLGSPVNRINIMANWAVQGLGNDWSHWGSANTAWQQKSWLGRSKASVVPRLQYWWFRAQLLVLSVSFHVNRTVQRLLEWITGRRQYGFEDIMDRQMMKTMKDRFGITLNEETFTA